jgi:SET domain-containing protein
MVGMKELEIKFDPIKGRGVYALESILKGEIIEICQLLLVPYEEAIDSLDPYVFTYNKKYLAVALGNGSLFNHHNHPNALCYFEFKDKLLVFEAKKDIHIGEEIFINYGYSENDKKKFGIV